MRRFAARTNGGSADAPNLQNGELLQLADYYKQHREFGYHTLARIALGFFREGDKFRAGSKFSTTFAKARVPRGLLPAIWSRALSMSASIDKKDKGATASFTPSNGLSKSFWGFMARAAFRQLKRERARRIPSPPAVTPKAPTSVPAEPPAKRPALPPKPPIPVTPVTRIIPPILPPPKVKLPPGVLPQRPSAGAGSLLLILIALLVVSKG